MRSKFYVKSYFFAFIVLSIANLQNFVRSDGADKNSDPVGNSFDIKSDQDFTDRVLNSKDAVITQFHAPLV